MTIHFLPPQASSVASKVDFLYLGLLAICGFVLFGIFFVISFFLFKYRRGRPAFRRPPQISSLPFELTWTIIPLIVFMVLFVWGARVYSDLQQIPAHAMEVNVVGKQWMWKMQHPGGQREINELHVPVGKAVKVTLASQDVIHSFYIPAFRIKQDAVPGRFTTEWFEATRAGTYPIFCAEYCGGDHSRMLGQIIVMEQADYERWLKSRATLPPLAESGEKLFRSIGCSGCHAGNSIVRSPPLQGLFGSSIPLQGGRTVIADEGYLRDSIFQPQRDVRAGYEPLMPSYQGQITEEQLFELIAYIKSLKPMITEAAR